MKKIGQDVLGLTVLDRRLKRNRKKNNVLLRGGGPSIHMKKKRSGAEGFELDIGCKKNQRSVSTRCELERDQM
jgi:hypothetical protein